MAMSARMVRLATTAMTLALSASVRSANSTVCDSNLGTVLLQTQRFLEKTLATTTESKVLHSGDTVFFSVPSTGHALTVQGDGEVNTKWGDRGTQQKFVIEKINEPMEGEIHSGDAVFLTAWTGKALTVSGENVHTKWAHRGALQRLVILSAAGAGQITSGTQVFLQSHEGTFVDGNSQDKPDEVLARFEDQGVWQQFIVESADAPQNTMALNTWNHFELLNALRAKGMTCPGGVVYQPNPVPLKLDCRLAGVSMAHARDMAEQGYFSHVSQDGRGARDRAADRGMTAHAENIAAGRSGATDVLLQLQKSEEHCNAMMHPEFKTVGVAHAEGGPYAHYWVQMFSRTDESSSDSSCYPVTSQ